MLGIEELKAEIGITETTVECPVKNCTKKVEKQRTVFKRADKFKCPNHNIYISPSTFEYQNELDNLLWKEEADLDLFKRIKTVKRESRIARDNSEDAVTWNVFRFFEKKNHVSASLSEVIGVTAKMPEVIYWSYSQSQDGTWDMLDKGRKEFELVPSKGSEPDIIILCRDALIIIESKLTATNKTQPSNPNVENKYTTGGLRWWNEVFSSDFKTVAINDKKYELSRFWLIGSWIAKQLNLDFYLVNLVLSDREKDIPQSFKRHIKEEQTRRFVRITWEEIYHHILNSNLSGEDTEVMIRYFWIKTIGYDANGKLQRAFSIP